MVFTLSLFGDKGSRFEGAVSEADLGSEQRGLKDTFSRSKPAWRGPNVVGIAQAFGQRTGKVKFLEKSYGNGVDKSA